MELHTNKLGAKRILFVLNDDVRVGRDKRYVAWRRQFFHFSSTLSSMRPTIQWMMACRTIVAAVAIGRLATKIKKAVNILVSFLLGYIVCLLSFFGVHLFPVHLREEAGCFWRRSAPNHREFFVIAPVRLSLTGVFLFTGEHLGVFEGA
jgi:hypothetical protein